MNVQNHNRRVGCGKNVTCVTIGRLDVWTAEYYAMPSIG